MATFYWILLRMRNVSDERCGTKTHILCSVTLFYENRAIYEIMSKNMVQPCRLQIDNIIRRMRFVRWIIKATNTLIIYNTYCLFRATVFMQTCLNITLYSHCLSKSVSETMDSRCCQVVPCCNRNVRRHKLLTFIYALCISLLVWYTNSFI